MTSLDQRYQLRSREYENAMALAWSLVRDLHKAGLPVDRLVERARVLYHQAWRDEVGRRPGVR